MIARLLHALRLVRWVLEVVRLAVVAAQGAIDAVVCVLDGRPSKPTHPPDGTDR